MCRPLWCGCRDPWTCRHYDEPKPLTDHGVDAYRAAALALIEAGCCPAPNIDALRALWRRGGADRELVLEISQRWVVAA